MNRLCDLSALACASAARAGQVKGVVHSVKARTNLISA